jgi:hypothetical protein
MRPKRDTASFNIKRVFILALRRLAIRNDLSRSKQLEQVLERDPEIAKELEIELQKN